MSDKSTGLSQHCHKTRIKMKKTTLCILALCAMAFMAADADAQNLQQQAVVKTRGKQSLTGEITPGRRISGAFVKIRDGNVQQSGADGRLSFPVPGGKYYIESVQNIDWSYWTAV